MKPTAHLTLCTLAFALAPAFGHAGETLAATGASASACAGVGTFTSLQNTIIEKASQGVVPLVQYVQRTRMIHQLDLAQTVAWLDERRALAAACRTATTGDDTVFAAE